MSVTFASPAAAGAETVEQRFVMEEVRWDASVAISDALDEQSRVRLIYNHGKLVFMGKSRRHERVSDCLGYLVIGIATHLKIPCEPAGEATFRSWPEVREQSPCSRYFRIGSTESSARGSKRNAGSGR